VAEVEVGLGPSSVTNTSPCWNGDMVPGSTFRYGSNFIIVTRRPALDEQAAERRGRDPLAERGDDAAGDEDVLGGRGGALRCVLHHDRPGEVAGEWTRVHSSLARARSSSVSTPGAGASRTRATPIASPCASGRSCSRPLDALERVHRQRDPRGERVARVGIDAHVAPHGRIALVPILGITQVRDRSPRKYSARPSSQ
jgi:hypothetical protein